MGIYQNEMIASQTVFAFCLPLLLEEVVTIEVVL